MTLEDFIAKYNGKVVADGECGNLVRQYWIDVDQTTPPSYPNSKDYWFNDVPGYSKVTVPQPGDIAIYNGHGAYFEGHSAIYAGNGQVFEQNADPDGSPAHLYARPTTYLLGYLRKQGGDDDMYAGKTAKEWADVADERQQRLDQLGKLVSVPAPIDGNSMPQVINNITAEAKRIDYLTAIVSNQDTSAADKLEQIKQIIGS